MSTLHSQKIGTIINYYYIKSDDYILKYQKKYMFANYNIFQQNSFLNYIIFLSIIKFYVHFMFQKWCSG